MSTYQFITARELYDIVFSQEQLSIDSLDLVEMEGWVRTNRDNGSVGFIHLNDGTYFKNVQLVYSKDLDEFEQIKKCNTGYCINIIGKVKLTPDGKQPFEIEVDKLTVLGECSDDYPLQKKRHGFEFLREIPHLRPRTNTFMAVFRIRSLLSMAIHEFFQGQGFVYVHTPIITANDGEGAGEAFTVTTRSDNKYEKDFFNTKASLTVTGQLHVEPFAMTFRDVYTFGPTFRAEESNTTTHAAEFWMIEPEIAFADLEDNMDLIEDMIKYCINYVLANAPEEMNFLNEMIEKGLIDRLKKLVNSSFAKMTYTEAIELIKKADVKFEKKVDWGDDLAREHERYICEKVIKGPVFLTDYPKDIKSFYMLQNDDGKTVSAADLLVPGIGELVGGSAREYRYDKLKARIEELNMELEPLQWYLDLRKYGDYKHAGFGIGFERFLMYITGMENIRDVTPYPRTPRNLKC